MLDIWRWEYEDIGGERKLYFSGINSRAGYIEVGI